MPHSIVMPSFGMYTAEGQLVAWLVSHGAPVRAGEPILEIETEKATESVVAPAAGVLHEVASPGARLKEEDLLGYVLALGEAPPALIDPVTTAPVVGKPVSSLQGLTQKPNSSFQALPRARQPSKRLLARALLGLMVSSGAGDLLGLDLADENPDSVQIGSRSPGSRKRVQASVAASATRVIASPLARRLAAESELDLSQLSGSGPNGRIIERDVTAALRSRSHDEMQDDSEPQRLLCELLGQSPQSIGFGVVQEGLTIESRILGRSVQYAVYLPPDYGISARLYPVVYLLHGYGDHYGSWVQFGQSNQVADEGIARRTIPPMILICPDGGTSFYINSYDDSVRYEDFFLTEFIPEIESRYRVRGDKRYRGLAGISMGGFGALAYALRHSEVFSICAAFSASVLTYEEVLAEPVKRWNRIYGPVYGPDLAGNDRLTEHLISHDPINLLKKASPDVLKCLNFYLDCGDDDVFYKGNSALHVLLRDLNLPHEYRVRDGGHAWSYWKSGLPDVLGFIGAKFMNRQVGERNEE